MARIDYIKIYETFAAFNEFGSFKHMRDVDGRDPEAVRTAEDARTNEMRDVCRRYEGFSPTERRYFRDALLVKHMVDDVNEACRDRGINFRFPDT